MKSFLSWLGRCLVTAIFTAALIWLLIFSSLQVYYYGYDRGVNHAVEMFNKP